MNGVERPTATVGPSRVREEGARTESVARHRRTAERALQIFVALIRQSGEIGLDESEMALLYGTCEELECLIAWLKEMEGEKGWSADPS